MYNILQLNIYKTFRQTYRNIVDLLGIGIFLFSFYATYTTLILTIYKEFYTVKLIKIR